MEAQFPGMDYDFLRYMGVFPENQRRIQSHYTPYFEQCQRVVDLACGDADFVEMLVERGIDVVGVDSDDKAYAAAAAKGLPVVQQDIFDWLAAQPDASFDGVFSAHLIEHIPYPKVIELVEQSYRVLQPGGVILLVTPNARSLFSHLEMFYTHFGHVTFYHPRLVSFFLDRAGFEEVQFGENPETASPLLFDLRRFLVAPPLPAINWENDPSLPDMPPDEVRPKPVGLPSRPASARDDLQEEFEVAYQREVPLQGRTPFHYLSYWAKRLLTRWLVQPLTDSLAQELRARIAQDEQRRALTEAQAMIIELVGQQAAQLHALLQQEQTIRRSQVSALENANRELYQRVQTFGTDLQTLNGPFESYIWAYKPEAANDAHEEQA